MPLDVSTFRINPTTSVASSADQVLADPSDSGRTVDGLSKLCEHVVQQLFTRRASVQFDSGGCDFVDRLLIGKASTEMDVFLAFSSSIGQVVQYLQGNSNANDDPTAQISSVRINKLIVAPGLIQLNITVINAAGTARVVPLPLDFLL